MLISVDPVLCEANGVCVGIAPEVFALDDDDRLHVLVPDPPDALRDRAARAVRSCPKAALTLSG